MYKCVIYFIVAIISLLFISLSEPIVYFFQLLSFRLNNYLYAEYVLKFLLKNQQGHYLKFKNFVDSMLNKILELRKMRLNVISDWLNISCSINLFYNTFTLLQMQKNIRVWWHCWNFVDELVECFQRQLIDHSFKVASRCKLLDSRSNEYLQRTLSSAFES